MKTHNVKKDEDGDPYHLQVSWQTFRVHSEDSSLPSDDLRITASRTGLFKLFLNPQERMFLHESMWSWCFGGFS